MSSEAKTVRPERVPVWLGTGEVRVLVGEGSPEVLALYPKLGTLEDMWQGSLNDPRLCLSGALMAHVTLAPDKHPQGVATGQLYILGEGHLQFGEVNDTECLRFQLKSTEDDAQVGFLLTAAPLLDTCLVTLQWQPYPFALHSVGRNGLIASNVAAPVPSMEKSSRRARVARHGSSAGGNDVIGADDHGLSELADLLPTGYSLSAVFMNGRTEDSRGWLITVVGTNGYTGTGGAKATLHEAVHATHAVLRADTVLR